MEYIPDVIQAVAGDDYQVYAYFSDGSIHLFDAKPLIARGGVFAQLADEDFFCDRLTVLNQTVAWDLSGNLDPTCCVDIDPIELYETTPLVSDPLVDVA